MSKRPYLTDSRSETPRDFGGERGTTVVLYSRPGCHLCQEALDRIVALHDEGLRFELREVDIDSDDLLLRRMLEKIPVVEVDGVVVSELSLDATALRARLDTVRTADDRGDDRGA